MISFKDIYKFILDFLFTKRCRYCHKPCNITDNICENCAHDIPRIEGDICYKCGCSKIICECKKKSHFYESVCAPYYYEGAPKKSVIALKYQRNDNIIRSLSEDMASCVKERYKDLDFDICGFVPMHKSDEKKRGFNQAQLLCEKIATELEIPCEKLFIKDFKSKSQHKLSEIGRTGNIFGTIIFNKDAKTDVTGMRILLCDDIKTTGATLDECAKILLFAGAAEVRCITACVARPKVKKNFSASENEVNW